MAAVTQFCFALETAAEPLKADKEVVMAAVTQDGNALELAAEPLKADKEVVMAAVTQKGAALEFAAEPLDGDKEVVIAAVTQDGAALQFSAKPLKDLGMPSSFSHDLVLQMFEASDQDGNGFLDEEEMAELLENLGMDPDDTHELLASADSNKDGKIDY